MSSIQQTVTIITRPNVEIRGQESFKSHGGREVRVTEGTVIPTKVVKLQTQLSFMKESTSNTMHLP